MYGGIQTKTSYFSISATLCNLAGCKQANKCLNTNSIWENYPENIMAYLIDFIAIFKKTRSL